MKARLAPLAIVLLLLGGPGAAEARVGYLNRPDVHGDQVVFTAEDDLWLVSDRGGAARRLTSHPGVETAPQFSPDGKWIAFSGDYDGNQDVYLVPAGGGEPTRLTWHPSPDGVIGWTPDGAAVLFRSPRDHPHGLAEIFRVSPAGGEPAKVPLGYAFRLAIDPLSGLWAFNRQSWESRTWKRYRGGTAPGIWVGDPRKADFRKVTAFDGLNAFPMWHGGRVYFLSDQGGTANLWSMKPDGAERKRLTDLQGFDARFPSMGPDGRIAFSLAGDIHLFDPATGSERKLDIDLPSERALTRLRYPNPARFLDWFELSPEGDRVAVVARGEIWSVPVKPGVTIPITRGSGVRERWASFDREGKRLAYVSDATGEQEIRVLDAWGRGEPKTVRAAGQSGYLFPPALSPDGKWLAYSDQTGSLYVQAVAGGAPRLADRSTQWRIRDYTWSPDGRWLAYSKTLPTDYQALHLYDTQAGKVHCLSSAFTYDYSPAWDPQGRYLYFVSDRATNPVLDTRDSQNVELRNTKLFALLLSRKVKNPVAPLEGMPPTEAEAADKARQKQQEKEKEEAAGGKPRPPEPIELELDGLAGRVIELPVPVGTYAGLGATAKTLFFLSFPIQGMGEGPSWPAEPEPRATLMAYDLEKKKAKPFMEGVGAYSLPTGGAKLAVMKKKGEIFVLGADAPPTPEALGEARVALEHLVVEVDPREEWRQIYREAWRQMRDFYWDAGMGGVDWKAMGARYEGLLPRVATRSELNDLIGELIGELGTSHTYVWGGDPGVEPPRVSTGLLGADLERQGDAFRVARIYRGDAADNARSPLSEPGVEVREGDFILAVNHGRFTPGRPFESHLAGLAGKPVVLSVGKSARDPKAREVVVVPLASEDPLRYADWVRQNRELVAARTGGKVGYLHLPDMSTDGLTRFNTWFYPQLDKQALIVDARFNGGGFVSQQIVERLRRRVVAFDRTRQGAVFTYPARVLNGPFVVLTNEWAGSDGDIFPMVIQLEKLAPVIGVRTWGGVIGISGERQAVDTGMGTEPEFAYWNPQSGWNPENRGVTPDIEVDDLPQELARGQDAQLERGLQEVLQLLKSRPPVVPEFGPVRDRSRDAFRPELPR
ncbi:MAG TPA: PDZ domain-containing protein [Myxococcota bacterium]|nr:PDZ domain-containing protein [Myxococcota bacterium]HRY96208.1 PDZ domain-containing protein [Myxococcota bacterium]